MPTARIDPIADFYTQERLGYYRELHERYPLWCGDWPLVEKRNWEYGFWSRSRRVNNILGIDAFHRAPLPLTSVDRVLLRAVLLSFNRPGEHHTDEWPDLALSLVKEWSTEFVSLFESPPARAASKFFSLRAQALLPLKGRDLEPLMKDIESAWVAIGREIRAIPNLQGGIRCNLSNRLLAQLKRQGQDLISTLAVFEPSSDQLAAVREILGSETDLLTDLQGERLRSLERQGRTEEADKERRELYSGIDEEHGTLDLARRLAFPMLSSNEITHALGHTGGKLHKAKIAKVVVDFLADRLPIARKTVVNRIRLGEDQLPGAS